MNFFNFFKKGSYLLLFFVVLFFTSLGLTAIFSKYIHVVTITGISECKSFENGTIPDIESCKVLPGSLAILVTKNSPMFSFVQPTSKIMLALSYYALIFFVLFLVAAAVYYYSGNPRMSIVFVALSIASLFLAAILASPVSPNDLVCYKPENANFVICHSYVGMEDGYILLKPSRYEVTEKVPLDWVVGKIAFVGNPLFGKILFIYSTMSNLARYLISIIYHGYVPAEYKIYYLVEK